MRDDRRRVSRGLRNVACAVAAMSIAGCSSVRVNVAQPPEPSAPRGEFDQVASLRAIGGSAVFGKVRVVDRGAGAAVLVSMMNMPPGDYRVAFHQTPNCTSPNGFSAGPAWAPAGRKPDELTPVEHVNTENRVEVEFRVAGLHASGPNGVAGRSVVIHAGRRIDEARPDVPNERIACGVFEPARPLAF
jgi:Cu-Zn family superoxide dismutase